MNVHYLQHAEVKREVVKIWTEERREGSTFFTRLQKFTRFYKWFCKKQAADLCSLESEAKKGFSAAQATFQANSHSVEAQRYLAQRQFQLLSFKSMKEEGRTLRARLRWRSKDDAMTREFFEAIHEKPIRSSITELNNPSGDSFRQLAKIETACVDFYSELYAALGRNEHTRRCE